MAITENDLHSFVDGMLSDERTVVVEQWLAEHPDDAAKVQKWFEQNEALQHMFAMPEEDLTDISYENDEALIMAMSKKAEQAEQDAKPKKQWFDWRMIAAAFPMLIIGGITGSLGTLQYAERQSDMDGFAYVQNLPEVSRASFAIYSGEKKHPVEVRSVDDKEHLIAWLGKRIDKKLTPPDLTSKGFNLFGGRILPLEGKPSAMLMYEDITGERLTLVIGQNKNNEDTSFSFAQKDGIQTFYWIDQEFGYAISGKMSRVQMEAIANVVYEQL
ncbi:MAG: anti-sigma factor [Alphaproteobacteria bacterium]|nr:anti-sigma factor [Alphaproteobacteria bacterium]